jgi:hypothetical protein
METIYRSDVSHDEFIIDRITYHIEKDNTERNDILIKLNYIDKLIDNLSLMNSIIEEYIKMKEHYILYEYNKKCRYPLFKIERYTINNITYNRFTLNQFKRFYIDNIHHIIDTTNIYIEIKEREDDGWTYICDKTRIKKEKMNQLLDEINQIKHQ